MDAQRQSDQERHSHPGQRQLERRRKALEHEAEHRPVLDVRLSEIALDDPSEVARELDEEWLVQPERMPDPGDVLR